MYSGLAAGSPDRSGFPVVCRALIELDLLLHPEAGSSRPEAPEAGPFGSEPGPSEKETGPSGSEPGPSGGGAGSERYGTFWAAGAAGPEAGASFESNRIKSEANLAREAARGRALDAACAVLLPLLYYSQA